MLHLLQNLKFGPGADVGDDQDSYDYRIQGDRRRGERRKKDERRGVLRWDPLKKERRTGKDRRKPDKNKQ